MGTGADGARSMDRLNGRLAGWLTLVGVVAAIGYATRFSNVQRERDVVFKWSTAISELITFAIILVIVLWIARGLPKREMFALRAPRSWGRALALAVGVFVVIWIVSLALGPLLHPDREQGLAPDHWEPAHAAAFALNVVALAVIGPIVEELTFRGLGFSLLERFGAWTAVLGIGVLFAIWHGLVEALPVLFVFGAGLAYLRSRTGSVYPGIVLHMLFNGLALLLAVTV
jgi:membrane protease YdiL (CAAX protease family)